MPARWPRTLSLIRWNNLDCLPLSRAEEGIVVFGSNGSGKTSAVYSTLVKSLFRLNLGALVLCAKADSVAQTIALAKEENRGQDIIVVSPDIPGQGFNILEYELVRYGSGKAIVENIVMLLMQALEVTSRQNGHHGDSFFEDAAKALLRHSLFVVITATEKIDLGLLLEVIQTLPQKANDLEEPERFTSLRLLAEAERNVTPERQYDLALSKKYFTNEFPGLADRTRSSITITLAVLLDNFLRYPLRQLFLSELSVSPELAFAGKILVLNVPTKEFGVTGRIAAVTWKYSFQRAVERRPELTSGQPFETIRPVCLLADEAQEFCVPTTDAAFQRTARSARAITLYSTQSKVNLYGQLGNDPTTRAQVDSLLACCQTRIGCANLCATTNQWFSDCLGKVLVKRQSRSVNAKNILESFLATNDASGKAANISISEQLDYSLPPSIFTGLKRGGTTNKGIVEAIVITGGDRFRANGKRWLRVRFNQLLKKPEPKGWRRFISRDVLITVPRLKG